MFLRSLLTALCFLIAPTGWAEPAQVLILRHGDKDAMVPKNHNLNEAGFARSLRLPDILLGRFGRPDFIFAPEPRAPNGANIRAIQTITPLAIRTGVNINTRFKVGEEDALAASLLNDARFKGKSVLICWEHKAIRRIVSQLGVVQPAPKWQSDDYDTLYLLRFSDGKPLFMLEQQ